MHHARKRGIIWQRLLLFQPKPHPAFQKNDVRIARYIVKSFVNSPCREQEDEALVDPESTPREPSPLRASVGNGLYSTLKVIHHICNCPFNNDFVILRKHDSHATSVSIPEKNGRTLGLPRPFLRTSI